MGLGMQINDQAQARNVLNMFNDLANNVKVGDKSSAVVLETANGGSVKVSTTDKPGFLGALFRNKADVQANKETRATFMTALKTLLEVDSDQDLVAKLGSDVLKLSDFNDNKGHPLSAFRIKTILNKIQDSLQDTVRSAPVQPQAQAPQAEEVDVPKPVVSNWAPLMGDLDFDEPEEVESKDPEPIEQREPEEVEPKEPETVKQSAPEKVESKAPETIKQPEPAKVESKGRESIKQPKANVPERKHVELSPDYDLGLGERGEFEYLSDIKNWQETTTDAFVEDTLAELEKNPFDQGDVILKSFDKLGQFFERKHNSVAFDSEVSVKIPKFNDMLAKELTADLKLNPGNPQAALQSAAKRMHTLNNDYGNYLANALTELSNEID